MIKVSNLTLCCFWTQIWEIVDNKYWICTTHDSIQKNFTEFTDRFKAENLCEFNEILIAAAIGLISNPFCYPWLDGWKIKVPFTLSS